MPSFNGTSASEYIQGTDQADTIHGNGGDDQIAGAGGGDTLYGDDGNDLILGEAGNDIIWGGAGHDQLSGGIGSDTIRGGAGDDDIWFGSGDSLYGDDGADWFIAEQGLGVAFTLLDGGLGLDLVDFRSATQALTLRMNDAAGGGQWLNNIEYVVMSAFGGAVHGGSIGEGMVGGSGVDVFHGGGGSDELIGDEGADILNGGAGDDFIDGGLGDDVIDGGDGIDTLSYTYLSSSLHVDLSLTGPQDTHYGMDTITGIEVVIGGAGADVLRGDAGNNRLEGGTWDDILAGGGGDDILMGGEGRDTVDYSRATSGVTVSLATQGVAANTGGDGVDTLSGFESIIGSAFDDVLTGDGADMNEFRGGGGSDRIDGGAGWDTVYYTGWAQAEDTTSTDLIRDVWKDINGAVFVRTADGAIDTLIGIDTVAFENFNYTSLSLNQIGIVHQGTAAAERFWGDSGRDTISGGGGNDIIHGGPANGGYDMDDILRGEGGDDQLFGDGGTDALYGGDGNDRLQGGEYGRNQLYGEAGNDTYVIGNHEYTPDQIYELEGEGIDTIILDGVIAGIAANVENLIWIGTHDGTGYYTGVFGNDLANNITGNVGHNDISGEGGSDVISGGDGNDRIWAEGRDQFSTVGVGNDTIHGDGGADIIYGGAGADLLYGDDGADVVTGGAGADTLSGGAGVDDLSGGQGNDTISGGTDADTLKGDAGADTLTGGAGNDTIDGGADLDVAVFAGLRSAYIVTIVGPTITVTGPDGTDTLTNVERLRFSDQEMNLTGLSGTEGADTMPGTSGDDYLYGAGGDDTLMGTAGNDVFDGGAGSDTVDYRNAASGVTVSLALTTAQAVGGGQGSDQLSSIENLTGSAFADRLTGVAGGRVDGGAGDDILNGRDHGASLIGGAGADTLLLDQTGALPTVGIGGATLDGGSGIDTLDARGATYDIRIDYQYGGSLRIGGEFGPMSYALSGIERFLTGSGNDYLEFTTLTVSLNIQSGAGNDYVSTTYNASSTIDAGDGDDTIDAGANYYSVAHGGAGNDEIRFNQNSDVYGDAGDDLFTGFGSNPGTGAYAIVDGGDGVDTLRILGSQHVNLTTGFYDAESGGRLAQLTSIENVELRVGYSGGGGSVIGNDGANVIVATSPDALITRVDLFGMGGDDTLGGHLGDDLLEGGDGDDTITGGLGDDIIRGDAGEDTAIFTRSRSAYTVTVLTDRVIVSGPDGTDTLWDVEWLQFADRAMEIVRPMNLVGGAGDDTLIGNALNDSLTGGDGNDVLRGRGGTDVLVGGAGIDTADYSTAASGMRAQLNSNASSNDGDGGTDTFSGVENLTGSAFNDVLIGDGNANVLRGGPGADTLIGLAGNDVIWGGSGALNTLSGGLGNDTYVLEAADSIVEGLGEGTDTVDARINTYILANNVENLVFGGTGDFAGTGNDLNNVITGGAGADVLRGRGGVDTLNGGAGMDTADYGLAAGAVTLRLDQQRASKDGDGAFDYLSSIEHAIGSNFNDVIYGNGANNVLMGAGGSDVLAGFNGDDILMGGSGGMNNQLFGGNGNDWYVLDAFDSCIEYAGEGIDTVEARVGSYTLAANIENLLYTGPGKFVGIGNTLNNVITGGDLNDMLRGGGGNDRLFGGDGRDEVQLRGSKAQYTVTAEGAGWRIVDSVAVRDGSTYVESVEVLRFLNGNTTTVLVPASSPADTGALAKDDPAQMSPLADGKDDFGPLVLPGAEVAAGVKGRDEVQVLPPADDEVVLSFDGAAAKGWDDMQVLPHVDEDLLLLFDGATEKGSEDMQVLPQAEDVLPTPRSFDGAAARGLDMQVLPGSADDFLLPPDAFDGFDGFMAKDWDDMQVLPDPGDEAILVLEQLLGASDIHAGLSGGLDPTGHGFEQVRDLLDPWA